MTKGLDNGAAASAILDLAAPDELSQALCQALQVTQAGLQAGQALAGEIVDPVTVAHRVKAQQLAHLLEGETGILGATDELQRPQCILAVAAIAAVAGGLGQKANALVIAYGFNIDASRRGQLAYGHHGLPLDSVLRYGV